VVVPLFSVIEDASARQSLRELMCDYHRELVADRRTDMEAQVLEIILELEQSSYEPAITIKEITQRFAEKHGEDYERKITPHWIGHIVRRKLGLKTERYREGYVIAASERPKLDRLFERYGILSQPVNLVNSVNSGKGLETQPETDTPFII
jgi:hypothetical protein